ncbi:unnamed protein product, partial [Hapterophycus canaliculatus]
RELLDRGEENYIFHRGLQCALPSGALKASGRLREAQKAALTELYRGLREKFEGSPSAARIPLTFLEGEDLRSSL